MSAGRPRLGTLEAAAFVAGLWATWLGLQRWEDRRVHRFTGFEAFVPTDEELCRAKLRLARVRPGETVYDLGSGDGRVLLIAALEFEARAVGIEIRPELVRLARRRARRARCGRSVRLRREDFTKTSFHDADVVFAYLTSGTLGSVRKRLVRCLRQGARVVTHDFPMPGWEPSTTELWHGDDHSAQIYLYERNGSQVAPERPPTRVPLYRPFGPSLLHHGGRGSR